MDDYMSKPYTREDLRRMLERWRPGGPQREADLPMTAATDVPASVSPTRNLDEKALSALAALGGESGTDDLVSRVIGAYLESSQRLAATIRDAARAADVESMTRAAHNLKSSSAQVGARTVSTLCKELEARGRAGDLEGARELVPRVDAALEAAHEELAIRQLGVSDV